MVAYTRRLAAAYLPGGTPTNVYTAPNGQTTIIRDLIVDNAQSSPQAVMVLVTSPGSTPRIFDDPALPGRTTAHVDLRQEILPGESIQVTPGAGGITVIVTGYVFPLSPA